MRVGYGRVPTVDQNPDAQRDALAAAGCGQVLIDKASGKLARRPGLDKALLVAREGDPAIYHLAIDSTVIPVDACVDAIVALATVSGTLGGAE